MSRWVADLRMTCLCTWLSGGTSITTSPITCETELDVPRVLALSMEPRGMLAQWVHASDDSPESLTVWLGTQSPSRAQADMAAALGWPDARVRVISGHVGGAFGAKSSVCPEDLAIVLAARQLRASVRWQSTRSEEFTSGMHGRGARLQGRLSLSADGRFDALTADLRFTVGAWLPFSAVAPLRNAARILPGPYRVAKLDVQGSAGLSHSAPVTIYRGAGRPEAALLMETLVEQAARAAGMDPVALRRRNLVSASDMPYTTPTGEVFDSGDYLRALTQACELFDYEGQRQLQAKRRAQGEVVGIGLALYVEPCGTGWESAHVDWHEDGTVTVATGSPAQGQGHGTTYARIAAQALGLRPEAVTVIYGDTALCPPGVGALASRSTAIAGSAIVQACHELKARRAAGEALPLSAGGRFTAAESWSYGCVIARMSVDRDTGRPTIEQIVWADDAGHIVHPELAKGQLIGGLAQGLGQAPHHRYCGVGLCTFDLRQHGFGDARHAGKLIQREGAGLAQGGKCFAYAGWFCLRFFGFGSSHVFRYDVYLFDILNLCTLMVLLNIVHYPRHRNDQP